MAMSQRMLCLQRGWLKLGAATPETGVRAVTSYAAAAALQHLKQQNFDVK
jgi:hypothetical protein